VTGPRRGVGGVWLLLGSYDEPFEVGRSRLRRMRFAMGIQSYFCSLIASLLPGNGVVERSRRSQWPHCAPAIKVLRIRKCLIVGTRSVRRASGLLETGFCVTCRPELSRASRCYRKPGFACPRLLSRVCTSAAILVMRQVSDVRSIPRLATFFSA
jgi:hypothetical protein